MSMIVKQCSVSEIECAPNFSALLEEYASYAIEGMPHPSVKMETYKILEKTGTQYSIGAFLDGRLTGFMSILLSVIPHYGIIGAFSESLFVAMEYRKFGAGLKLIRAGEKIARDKGAPGLIISAPVGGALAEVLPEIGYSDTHILFFRKLGNA